MPVQMLPIYINAWGTTGGLAMAIMRRIAVLGGGNGAFITAADLTLRGHQVTLCELPQVAENVAGVLETRAIQLEVVGSPGIRPGLARLHDVTTNVAEALSEAEIAMIVVPAFAQRAFAEASAPFLQEGQTVVLTPGNFGGALEFAKILREKGKKRSAAIAEMECMIYSGFKASATAAWVSGYKRGLRVAALPGTATPQVLAALHDLYPDLRQARNVLETGLRNMNTVVHAPIVVHNAGWIEKTKGEFLFYWDGCTPGVARSVEGVDRERIAVGKAFGLNLPSVVEVLHEWYGHEGARGISPYEMLSTNPVYVKDSAPKALRHRFLLEDVPFGMVPMESLGRLAEVPTPITSAVITLAEQLTEVDLRAQARDLAALGLEGLSAEQLRTLVDAVPV
jgi:opine dehydrogenase